jgi:hypothetical protein
MSLLFHYANGFLASPLPLLPASQQLTLIPLALSSYPTSTGRPQEKKEEAT